MYTYVCLKITDKLIAWMGGAFVIILEHSFSVVWLMKGK